MEKTKKGVNCDCEGLYIGIWGAEVCYKSHTLFIGESEKHALRFHIECLHAPLKLLFVSTSHFSCEKRYTIVTNFWARKHSHTLTHRENDRPRAYTPTVGAPRVRLHVEGLSCFFSFITATEVKS